MSDNRKGYANPQLLITTEALSKRVALADGDVTRPEIAAVVNRFEGAARFRARSSTGSSRSLV